MRTSYCQTCDLRLTNKLLYNILYIYCKEPLVSLCVTYYAMFIIKSLLSSMWPKCLQSNCVYHVTHLILLASLLLQYVYYHYIVRHVTLEPPISCCITCYWCDVITYWSVFIIRWWHWQTCDLRLGPTNIEVVLMIK